MNYQNKILWYQGQFLQAAHFQQQERYFESLVTTATRAITSLNYGVSNIAIDQELLKSGKVAITAISGIMPDGTPFNVPHNDIITNFLEIDLTHQKKYIYLGIKHKTPHHQYNQAEDHLKDNRYQAAQLNVSNDTFTNNTEYQITIGKLTLQLLQKDEDKSSYSYIPILKIKAVKNDKTITIDHNYITPCYNIQDSTLLKRYIKDIHQLLVNRAEQLTNHLKSKKQDNTEYLIHLSLLNTINRYQWLFKHFQHSDMHPESLYQHYLQLAGELASFVRNKSKDLANLKYNHDDLFNCFTPIYSHIMKSLTIVLVQNAIPILVNKLGLGLWHGVIDKQQAIDEYQFILSVTSEIDLDQIKEHLPKHIKISTPKQVNFLVGHGLPGIKIKYLPSPPGEIPYHPDCCYFTLIKNHTMWQDIKEASQISFHISGDFPGLTLKLWSVKEE